MLRLNRHLRRKLAKISLAALLASGVPCTAQAGALTGVTLGADRTGANPTFCIVTGNPATCTSTLGYWPAAGGAFVHQGDGSQLGLTVGGVTKSFPAWWATLGTAATQNVGPGGVASYGDSRFAGNAAAALAAAALDGTAYMATYNVAPGLGVTAAHANTLGINAAIAAVGAKGGGRVLLPCGRFYVDGPIDNNVPRVLVQGCGSDPIHNAGTNETRGTEIRPTFAGTVLKHRTPSSPTSVEFGGGGFVDLLVDGNDIGTRLLEVTSVLLGRYDLTLLNSVGSDAALFKAGNVGTDVAENAGIQYASIHLRVRQLDGAAAQAAAGVVFDGTSTANVSINHDIDLAITHCNGDALLLKNADNNIIALSAYRGAGCTGRTLNAYGASATSTGGSANFFTYLAGAGPIYAQGTDTPGVTLGVFNTVDRLDTGNGSPLPTAGVGSSWAWTDTTGVRHLPSMVLAAPLAPSSGGTGNTGGALPAWNGLTTSSTGGSGVGVSFVFAYALQTGKVLQTRLTLHITYSSAPGSVSFTMPSGYVCQGIASIPGYRTSDGAMVTANCPNGSPTLTMRSATGGLPGAGSDDYVTFNGAIEIQ